MRTRRMATPVVIEKHQDLRGCLAAIAEFAVGAVLVVILLALIGTGPW